MNTTKKWDVRTEPYGGFSVNIKTGTVKETSPKTTTLVRYRVAGSKGRWVRVVVVGNVPKDLQLFATTYDAQQKQAAANRAARKKDQRKTTKKLGPLTTPVPNIATPWVK